MTCKKFCSAARCNRVGQVGSSFEGTRKYLKTSLVSLSSIISVSRLIYRQVAVKIISRWNLFLNNHLFVSKMGHLSSYYVNLHYCVDG